MVSKTKCTERANKYQIPKFGLSYFSSNFNGVFFPQNAHLYELPLNQNRK
jgi:hypothetical protein